MITDVEGTTRFARALLPLAASAFRALGGADRAVASEALDAFLIAPGPATYLSATRVLASLRRRALIGGAARPTMRRSLDEAVSALRAAVGAPLADRIATDLPLDARTGQRLQSLAALATAYEQLASRVAADTDEMRRRLRAGAPRRTNTRK
jgi:hypothetical protein